ncbi:MAG TPA: response regulator transcription factor [Mycobacteriales bacterium]|nr:response regulator transcription factor [Mycobacteriales bacterium]
MGASDTGNGPSADRSQVRCLVVDDHAAVREGVKMILTRDREISVIGESGSGDGAIEMADKRRPDVIVMDVRMPGRDGVEVLRHIGPPPPPVILMTAYASDERLAEGGPLAFAVVHKPFSAPHMVDLVSRARAS